MAYTAQPIGLLANLAQYSLDWANEPRLNAKYPTHRLYPIIKACYKEIISELNRISDYSYWGAYEISTVNGTDEFVLPNNFGQIQRIVEINTATGLPKYELWSRARLNPLGPTFRIEGNILRWLPKWTAGAKTLQIDYTISGDADMMFSTGLDTSVSGNTTTVFIPDLTPSEGYFDERPGALVGSWLRLISNGSNAMPTNYHVWPLQERLIKTSSHTGTDGFTITIEPAFDFNPASLGGSPPTVTYEIVPDGYSAMMHVVALRVAVMLHRIEGNTKRAANLQAEYISKMREIKLSVSNHMDRENRFEHDTHFQLQDLWAIL